MLYWDSSALFSSFIEERHTDQVRRFLAQEPESRAYTSIITPLEVESALQRRLNEKSLSAKEADAARLYICDFRRSVFLVITDQNALDTALHLQKIYGLRPGDALQLASARLGTNDPNAVSFLCLDQRLNEAARREGFRTVFC